MLTEADTCTKLILPRLQSAGWDTDPHSFCEQHSFTDGRIITAGPRARRKPRKRADYLIRYTRDFTIVVVEAKPEDAAPGEGLQQAKDYAEILGLSFAYSTNGHSIIEFDYLSGREMYFVGGQIEIVVHMVDELNANGKQLCVVKYTDYAGQKVRTVCPLADPFDLLCHLAYNAPLRTRRERAERLKKAKTDLFDRYGPEAKQVPVQRSWVSSASQSSRGQP